MWHLCFERVTFLGTGGRGSKLTRGWQFAQRTSGVEGGCRVKGYRGRSHTSGVRHLHNCWIHVGITVVVLDQVCISGHCVCVCVCVFLYPWTMSIVKIVLLSLSLYLSLRLSLSLSLSRSVSLSRFQCRNQLVWNTGRSAVRVSTTKNMCYQLLTWYMEGIL